MIQIKQSKTADTRSCDFVNVTKDQLLESSHQHISDVSQGLLFFRKMLIDASMNHDHDKLSDIDGFHRDFITGFKQTKWWDNHRKVNRHHLIAEDGVPEDVNLIDVLDMITDMVMASKGRGTSFPIEIHPDILMAAFINTVTLLKLNVEVIRDYND